MALHIPPTASDSLLSLARQEQHLQSHLQVLLDAQSSGLLAGLGHVDPGSIGSNTPASSPAPHTRHPQTQTQTFQPPRQPPSKPIGIRGARLGISRTIADLAALKAQQSSLLETELEDRGQDLEIVENLARKQEGLRDAIQHIEAAPTTSRISSLRSEERILSDEIAEMETKLLQMKARQRHVLREVAELDNSVQAKLSSYKESLSLAEKEVKSFLTRPPAHVTGLGEKEKGFWALSAERRTLDMAGDDLRDRMEGLRKKWREAEAERVALEEGNEVWSQVCSVVGDVERGLREEMKMMDGRAGRNGEATTGMRRILDLMGRAKGDIEDKLNLAEEKNWRLLVCCIGAELEAMIEGEGVLRAALGEAEGDEPFQERDWEEPSDHRNELNGLERSVYSENGVRLAEPSFKPQRRSEEEDDEPGPDLLISHQDTG